MKAFPLGNPSLLVMGLWDLSAFLDSDWDEPHDLRKSKTLGRTFS